MDWSTSHWLNEYLCKDFRNVIIKYELISAPLNENDLPHFNCEIRSSFNNYEAAMAWKSSFEQATNINYIHLDSAANMKNFSVCKDVVCHRSDKKKVVKMGDEKWLKDEAFTMYKATNCKAKISLRVKIPTPTSRDKYSKAGMLGWNVGMMIKVSSRQTLTHANRIHASAGG